jgi:RluA family pseudouridine synthase
LTGRLDAGPGFSLLYEDGDVLAVDKPEGLPVLPGGSTRATPLRDLVQRAYPSKIFVVHRLDKDVSGVLIFARNAEAHRRLSAQFAGHTVEKTYLALVHGVVREDSGEIDRPLRPFGSGRMGVDLQRGKPCSTRFAVTERLAHFSLVEVHPVTGRRHQIRVHLYAIGHPVVGDPLYGDRETQRRYPRLMLHAQRVSFDLPAGSRLTVEAPMSESFQRVLQSARLS